jgi:hypothetical protein
MLAPWVTVTEVKVDTLEQKRAAAWQYLNQRGISILHHGFNPGKEGRVPETIWNHSVVKDELQRRVADIFEESCGRKV